MQCLVKTKPITHPHQRYAQRTAEVIQHLAKELIEPGFVYQLCLHSFFLSFIANCNLVETSLQAVTYPASSGTDTARPAIGRTVPPSAIGSGNGGWLAPSCWQTVRKYHHRATECTKNGKKARGGARFVVFVGSV